jgi:hypothetical protein
MRKRTDRQLQPHPYAPLYKLVLRLRTQHPRDRKAQAIAYCEAVLADETLLRLALSFSFIEFDSHLARPGQKIAGYVAVGRD